MRSDSIAVEVAGGDQPPLVQPFLTVVGSAVKVLVRVDAAMRRGSAGAIRWRLVGMRLGSPARIEVGPEEASSPAAAQAVIGAALSGLASLEETATRPPEYFDVECLAAAKGIVEPLAHGVTRVELSAPSWGAVTPSRRLAANVDRLVGAGRQAFGSVRGRLEMLTIHRQEAFAVWDEVTGTGVRCFFDRAMLRDVRENFGNRVAVFGRIQYSAKGVPERMRVVEVRWLREQAELPQFADLEGIEITGGADSVEYVRGLRDG